jgi:hypothetical protein
MSLISTLLSSTQLRLGLPSGSFFLPFAPISYMNSSSPHLCYILCPSHPLGLYHSNYTWRTVRIMKLLAMHSPRTSCHLIPPSPNILLSTVLTLGVFSSLNIRDEVSLPYRAAGKILVLYTLIFTSFRQQTRKKWVLDWIDKHYQKSIPLNFLLNQILVC